MSLAESLSLISFISYIGAGACFLVSVGFWFGFKVQDLIKDLRNAARNEVNSEETVTVYMSVTPASNESPDKSVPDDQDTLDERDADTDEQAQTVTEMTDQTQPETEIEEDEYTDAQCQFLDADSTKTDDVPTEELREGTETDESVTLSGRENSERVELHMIKEIVFIHTDEVMP